MKVSIIIAILNSHEVVRRQILHFETMDLPDDVEIIFVDDGSDPPLKFSGLKNFHIYYTNEKKSWTQPAARNFGATKAKGEYLLMTDIDHILSRELIEAVRTCPWSVLRFRREFGVIDEEGNFTQDANILMIYGLPPERIQKRGVKVCPHSNSFAIKKDLFLELGGMCRQRSGTAYPNREEVILKEKIKVAVKKGRATICNDDARPTIYMIPNGRYCGDIDYNPFGLFHSLSRKHE